jgi:hypothetical protein
MGDKPPLTLLEAETLAALSLGRPLPFAHVSRTSSQTLQRLMRKGCITLNVVVGRRDVRASTSLERSMTEEGAKALRSTWQWLLLSSRGIR